jgi:hypothetical protein
VFTSFLFWFLLLGFFVYLGGVLEEKNHFILINSQKHQNIWFKEAPQTLAQPQTLYHLSEPVYIRTISSTATMKQQHNKEI